MSVPKIRRPSGACAIPSRTTLVRRDAGGPACPSKRISPRRGRRSPLIALRVVDFPAPFAPRIATISPCATVRSMPWSASTFAVLHAQSRASRAAARGHARPPPCRGTPRRPSGSPGSRRACPRRSSRRTRARRSARRRRITRLMSCSMSRTVMPRARDPADEPDELVGLVLVHAAGRLVEDRGASGPSRAPARSRGAAGRRTRGSRELDGAFARGPTNASSSTAARRPPPPPRAPAGAAGGARRRGRAGVRQCAARRGRSRARRAAGRGGCSGRCGRSPRCDDPVRAHPPDERLPSNRIGAAIGAVVPGDEVERRGLPGAVRPDEPDDRALPRRRTRRSTTAVEAAEALRDPAQLEERAHGDAPARRHVARLNAACAGAAGAPAGGPPSSPSSRGRTRACARWRSRGTAPGARTTSAAPTMTPGIEPEPPRITMRKRTTDSQKPNDSGEMIVIFAA